MKKLIILFALPFIINSCSNNDAEQLTELSYDGKGGISCKVNGTILKPKGGGMSGNTTCKFDYDPESGTPCLRIGFFNDGANDFKSITIFIGNLDFTTLQPQQFALTEESYYSGRFASFIINNIDNAYNTTAESTGEVKILHFDQAEGIITGTYWFNAVNESGEVIEIREGRFDMDAY